MKIKLSEVLSLYTAEQIDSFLKKYTGLNLTESNLKIEKIEDFYCPVGNNYNNNSTAGMLTKPDKGLIEKITNAIDAVLEKQKEKQGLSNPKTADEIVRPILNTPEIKNLVNVIVSDSDTKLKPTIDVIDKGTGIAGDNFDKTILSLQNGNKTTTDKSYLIGTFGQGGTTALPFSYATMIVSKHKGKYAFTIIKEYHFNNMKMSTFLYLKPGDEILELEEDDISITDANKYITIFTESESGTLIRMIKTEVSREYYSNDVTKPTDLVAYIGTEIYKSPIPIYVKDYREFARNNARWQGRSVEGNYTKLRKGRNYAKAYSSTLKFVYKNINCEVDCCVVLPEDPDEWSKDGACKTKYKEFNMHEKPIIYISNGQYIGGTNYTKIKNRGLPHLQYRLLVEVNLDMFEEKKYKMIATSRDGLKDIDFVKDFEDRLIDEICANETLRLLDAEIAKKSTRNTLSPETINRLQNKFARKYSSFLKLRKPIKQKPNDNNNGLGGDKIISDKLDDEVNILKIRMEDHKEFYRDQKINIGVTTNATKKANEDAKIYAYVSKDGAKFNSVDNFSKLSFNDRVVFQGGNLEPGEYKIYFAIYGKKIIESETRNFTVKKEILPNGEEDIRNQSKGLEIKIIQEDDKELIIDYREDKIEKAIVFTLCLSHEQLMENVFFDIKPSDLDEFKASLIEPLIGFVLGLGEEYDKLEPDLKNKMAASLCLSLKNIDK